MCGPAAIGLVSWPRASLVSAAAASSAMGATTCHCSQTWAKVMLSSCEAELSSTVMEVSGGIGGKCALHAFLDLGRTYLSVCLSVCMSGNDVRHEYWEGEALQCQTVEAARCLSELQHVDLKNVLRAERASEILPFPPAGEINGNPY